MIDNIENFSVLRSGCNIVNGNCLEVMKSMKSDSVDIVFTSPPYNRKRNDKYLFYSDDKSEYFEFICNSIDEFMRVCRGNVFINIQKNFYNKQDVFKVIGKYSDKICEIFVWEKSNPMPASGVNVTNAYEFIIVFGNTIKSNNTYTKNHITTSVAKMPKTHKAVMHKNVSDFFIKNFTKENDIVLDPFMGVGTTGLSCLEMNRKFVGIEISEEYYNDSLNNLKNFLTIQ